MLFSREDIEAWKAATRNVRRFLHMHVDEDFAETENVSRETLPNAPSPVESNLKPKSGSPAYFPDLVEGQQGRMDKNAFLRLKSGKMKMQLVEDLHGMSLFDARLHFYELIQAAYAGNKRSILLITGKGFAAPSKIRSSLASWINDPDLKPLILSYCRAQAKDGGDGAFYIYLSAKG